MDFASSFFFSHSDLIELYLRTCAMKRKAESVEKAESSMTLEVSLPSGRCATVSVLESGTVADLKIAAQKSLVQGFLRLAAPDAF